MAEYMSVVACRTELANQISDDDLPNWRSRIDWFVVIWPRFGDVVNRLRKARHSVEAMAWLETYKEFATSPIAVKAFGLLRSLLRSNQAYEVYRKSYRAAAELVAYERYFDEGDVGHQFTRELLLIRGKATFDRCTCSPAELLQFLIKNWFSVIDPGRRLPGRVDWSDYEAVYEWLNGQRPASRLRIDVQAIRLVSTIRLTVSDSDTGQLMTFELVFGDEGLDKIETYVRWFDAGFDPVSLIHVDYVRFESFGA